LKNLFTNTRHRLH